MSDRCERTEPEPHQAAKVGYKSFTCVVLRVQYLPIYSSLAQSVEHAAVNRSVVGSSPTGGVF